MVARVKARAIATALGVLGIVSVPVSAAAQLAEGTQESNSAEQTPSVPADDNAQAADPTPPPPEAAPSVYGPVLPKRNRDIMERYSGADTASDEQSPAAARDDTSTETLKLENVLSSSARYAPQILEALAKARAASGRLTASKGVFDLVFEAETYSYLSGFYDGQYARVQAIQPLTENGGQVQASYRVSRGDFPIYNDFFFTNQVGELLVRGVYSILRDKAIDDRRFGVRNAQFGQNIAGLEATLVAIGVQQRAIEAFNNWVGTGQQVLIFRELLELAEERQVGLRRQVQLGAQPDIILTENEQNLLRRQSLLVRAEADLARAANRLSLFWRDDKGRPLRPNLLQLPKQLPDIGVESATDMQSILERRPDLKIIENNIAQAQLKLQLDENDFLPKFDVFAELSNDFGNLGIGGPSRDGFETIVGLNFSVPLQRRNARGRIAESEAKIAGLNRARQQVEENVNNMVNDMAIAVEAAERLVTIAREEEIRAKKLAAGERRLFQAGASDFFLVNLREEAAANAGIRRLNAQFDLQRLRADLLAVAADTDALGLEAMGTGSTPFGE